MQEKLDQFQLFYKENPLGYIKDEFDRVKKDIINSRRGVVSDEYVEFDLWTKGFQSRQEYFSEFIEKILPCDRYHKLLEVGCGRTARLSRLLSTKGYEMTAIDPKILPGNGKSDTISYIKGEFCFGKTDITGFDAVVAQEPCEATEHIIRQCVAARKKFVISLCGTAHRLMNGKMLDDVYQWYDYLEEIGGDNCVVIKPEIIPGYICTVMVGFFTCCGGVD